MFRATDERLACIGIDQLLLVITQWSQGDSPVLPSVVNSALSRLHRAVIITLDSGVSLLVSNFSFHHCRSESKLFLSHSKILIFPISVRDVFLTHQTVLQQTPAECPIVLRLCTWHMYLYYAWHPVAVIAACQMLGANPRFWPVHQTHFLFV